MTFTKDWLNANIHHVLIDTKAAGYVEQFAPKEWKAFDAKGNFKGWFTSKKGAAGVL